MTTSLVPSNSIAVNGRYRVHKVTGVQRYAREIETRISSYGGGSQGIRFDLLSPVAAKGAAGHLWEQTTLPAMSRGRLLWSPSASGPAFYSRQIVTFHDIFPIENPEWYGKAYARWYGFLMRSLAARAMHLIAVSDYTRSRLVKILGCDPDRITVIVNGLTSGCERTSQEAIDATRNALQLPSRRYVLSLSSLEKRKNLVTTLEAWLRIQDRLPQDVWLILAGPSADETVYGQLNLPQGAPRVHYTGYVPEEFLSGLYSGACLFVFPSLAEGFGLPLLEAMACGVRCITSCTSSLPEVGGDVVAYIDPKDATALGEAILREISAGADPDRPFVPAIERARHFSWDTSARKTFDLLQTVAVTPEYSACANIFTPKGIHENSLRQTDLRGYAQQFSEDNFLREFRTTPENHLPASATAAYRRSTP